MTGLRGSRGRKRKMIRVKVPSEVSGVEFEYLVEEVSQLEDFGGKTQSEGMHESASQGHIIPGGQISTDLATSVQTLTYAPVPTPREDATPPESDSPSNLNWLIDFKVSSLFENVRDDASGQGNVPASSTTPAPDPELPLQDTEESCCASHSKVHRKPPFTYTELIEQALKERHQLTVSGIYQWISERFPYYNQNDDRWKNSVRHNLSINPHFRKGVKASQGAGHLWNLSDMQPVEEVTDKNNWKKNRLKNYLESLQPNEYSADLSPPIPSDPPLPYTEILHLDHTIDSSNEMKVDISTVQGGVQFQDDRGGDTILYTPLDDKYPYDRNLIMSTYTNGTEKVEIFSTDTISRKSILEYAAHDIIMEEQQNALIYSMYEEQEHYDALPLFPDEFTLSCYNNIPPLL